jgi:phospholipase C
MNLFYITDPILSVYERMIKMGRTAKIYYYDQQSSILSTVILVKNYPQIFATYDQFIDDCKSGSLPEYSFIEPNHNDRLGKDGSLVLASDQYPDHNVQEGEIFIANTFNAIRTNPDLWKSTALLVVYDEHGGIYDHVVPPNCTPDGYSAKAAETGTGAAFNFDRLGVRVPAILISPWIARGTVVPGIEDPANARIFEHASIPATVTQFFLQDDAKRTIREQNAQTFLDLLTDRLRPDDDCVVFSL